MKKLMLTLLLAGFMFSCTKKCDVSNAICEDIVPTNEACAAYFERWFFDQNTKDCRLESYSGCTARGFATKELCDECDCR